MATKNPTMTPEKLTPAVREQFRVIAPVAEARDGEDHRQRGTALNGVWVG